MNSEMYKRITERGEYENMVDILLSGTAATLVI